MANWHGSNARGEDSSWGNGDEGGVTSDNMRTVRKATLKDKLEHGVLA
jgi:hypothetical protein